MTCVSFPPSQRRAPFRGFHKGGGAHVVLESRPKQRPSLLGLSARSALARDARARCASRARGQRPLPVCPSPASLVRQSGRALCSGVLRRGLGRVRGPVWTKNRSGRALTCVSLPPSQRRAPFRGIHKGDTPLCALLVPFRASEKGPAARGRIPRIPCRRKAAFFFKKVRYCTAVHPPPSSGGIRGCKSALSMSACLGARGSLRGVAP